MLALELEVCDLELLAEWREGLAARHPGDTRERDAERYLQKLAWQIRAASSSVQSLAFCALYDFLFLDGEPEIDDTVEIVRRWTKYRLRIGFDHFPETAEAYLGDLMAIAHEVAPSAAYLRRSDGQ